MSGKLSLGELVARRRAELGMSLRDVDEATGGVVSYSTVHEMEQGKRTAFGDDKLDAIAVALGLPKATVRESAGRPAKRGTPFVLPDRASELTPKERKVVRAMVDALLDAKTR